MEALVFVRWNIYAVCSVALLILLTKCQWLGAGSQNMGLNMLSPG
jgi:hypothetical protein